METQMLMAPLLAAVVALTSPSFGCRTVEGARGDGSSEANTVSTAVETIFTDEGADATIQGSRSDVDRRTRAVLRDTGLMVTDAEYGDNATEREYEARGDDRVVHVELESRIATTTEVEVSYRLVTTGYRKGEARDVIRRIQQQRSRRGGARSPPCRSRARDA